MISIVRFFNDNNARLTYGDNKKSKLALMKILKDLKETRFSSDIEEYGDVFLDDSLEKKLGEYLNGILQSTPFYNMGIREFQKYLEEPYSFSTKKKAPSDFFNFDENRLSGLVDDKKWTFNINYVFNLFLLPMPSSMEIQRYAKYARVNLEGVENKDALMHAAPLSFALEFFNCLAEDLKNSQAANVLPYFHDISETIEKVIIPSIKKVNDSTSKSTIFKKIKTFYCSSLLDDCGFTRNIVSKTSSEEVTKSMINYIKSVTKCSDEDIFVGEKRKKVLLLNAEFAMPLFQRVKKTAYESPYCKLGANPQLKSYDSYCGYFTENFQNSFSDVDNINEAIIDTRDKEYALKHSEENGKVYLSSLLYILFYKEINSKAIMIFRKLKIDVDNDFACSRNDAVIFCKWMNQEIKKWEPYRMKFPYVMEQAQFFERAYLYYGGLKENLDEPSYDASNNFDESRQRIISEITKKSLEKINEETNNGAHFNVNESTFNPKLAKCIFLKNPDAFKKFWKFEKSPVDFSCLNWTRFINEFAMPDNLSGKGSRFVDSKQALNFLNLLGIKNIKKSTHENEIYIHLLNALNVFNVLEENYKDEKICKNFEAHSKQLSFIIKSANIENLDG